MRERVGKLCQQWRGRVAGGALEWAPLPRLPGQRSFNSRVTVTGEQRRLRERDLIFVLRPPNEE